MGLAVTFLSGTFLSSIQKRIKGGDSDLEPIDSWLITQGMVRGHQLSRALVPPALNMCYLLSPCESDRTRPFSPSDWVSNFLLSLHNLLKPQASSPKKHLLWSSAVVCALGPWGPRVCRSKGRLTVLTVPGQARVLRLSLLREETKAPDQLLKPLQPVNVAVLG